ncbi:hypothetical protein LXA43DRAFT_720675 [Ganoderma leucocontextum]|nr:hypothetical protein LXA43DRAFT_720675 [Ganoderma leucocontextum]
MRERPFPHAQHLVDLREALCKGTKRYFEIRSPTLVRQLSKRTLFCQLQKVDKRSKICDCCLRGNGSRCHLLPRVETSVSLQCFRPRQRYQGSLIGQVCTGIVYVPGSGCPDRDGGCQCSATDLISSSLAKLQTRLQHTTHSHWASHTTSRAILTSYSSYTTSRYSCLDLSLGIHASGAAIWVCRAGTACTTYVLGEAWGHGSLRALREHALRSCALIIGQGGVSLSDLLDIDAPGSRRHA